MTIAAAIGAIVGILVVLGAGAYLYGYVEERMSPGRLNKYDRRVFAALCLALPNGAPAHCLWEVTGLRPWRIYPALDRLERAGFVRRIVTDDGRAFYSLAGS